MTLEVSAPIFPLLPDEHHCPTGYSLPKRKRNKVALDIPILATTFSVSLVYEEKSYINITEKNCSSIENPQATENDNKIICCDLAVLGVLSPYTLLPHVTIMEISKDRYLPGPESFSEIEWLKISDLAKRVPINGVIHYAVQCCGFNWSPFAWGKLEEKMSCQSIVTKIHMMIWQWSSMALTESFHLKADIPKVKQDCFFTNEYNSPFACLILKELRIELADSCNETCGSRGVFIPFYIFRFFIFINQFFCI